ncbi:aflatoxin regulatory protein-domain-containing protein [Aspergillus cavernicola]|uniref:Aflatoxin regulatory protein-domain-containing protein n=1 Tax=Aspergillus cavernicola TaxID=176166 RepID=A0ABR4ISJ4_9EURO
MAALSSPGISSTIPPTVKLRGSCHACALSKLKCSQDKPTCARCSKRGTTCQYLASKRAGRKQGSRTGSFRSPIKTDHEPVSVNEDNDRRDLLAASTQLMQYALQHDQNLDVYRGHQHHHHQRTPSYPDNVPSLLPSACPTTSATTPLTFGHPDFDGFLASPMSFSLLDGADVDYFAGTDVNFKDLNGFPDTMSFFTSESTIPMLEDDLPKSSFMPDSETPLSDLSSSPPSTEVYNFRSPTQCSCFTRSLALLRELFPNPSAGCATASSDESDRPALPTILQVITQNEQTIQKVNQILDCYCSHDSYTLSILTLTVFKVLAWYGAVAQVSPTPNEGQTHPEQVDRAPTVIGGYHLEGEYQSRMAAQLVLSELHRVQRLVNTLFQRLKDQGPGNGSLARPGGVDLNGQKSLLPVNLLDHLADDLRAQLRGLSLEIVERLRRG